MIQISDALVADLLVDTDPGLDDPEGEILEGLVGRFRPALELFLSTMLATEDADCPSTSTGRRRSHQTL